MYKTKYAAALAANNLTREGLYKKTQETFDEVVELEKGLKETQESLVDADPEEISSINENIARLSTILATQDAYLVEKINGTNELKAFNKAKMQKAQNSRKFNNKGGDNGATPPAGGEKPATVVEMNNNTGGEQKQQPSTTSAAAGTQIPGEAHKPAETNTGNSQPQKQAPKKETTGKKLNFGAIFFGILLTAAGVGYGLHASKTGKWPFKK